MDKKTAEFLTDEDFGKIKVALYKYQRELRENIDPVLAEYGKDATVNPETGKITRNEKKEIKKD